jgi:hypothetical protein
MTDENIIRTKHIVNRTHMTIINNKSGINKIDIHKINTKKSKRPTQKIILIQIRRKIII